jgi:protein TonB
LKSPEPAEVGPVTEARIKRAMGIRYPDDARREGIEGTCLVDIVIDAAGRVTSARISKSSGDDRLDREALRAAESSTFHPARRGDTTIVSRARLPFKFVLR